jgi:hypothetical protein
VVVIPGPMEFVMGSPARTAAQEPLSGERIRKEMEKQGIGIHSQITVKRTPARLRKEKVVSNSRRSPRGYFLPERLTCCASAPPPDEAEGASVRVADEGEGSPVVRMLVSLPLSLGPGHQLAARQGVDGLLDFLA